MKYFDIYRKRVNQFGENDKDRVNNQRKQSFSIILSRSPNKVDFTIEQTSYDGILEENRQDEKKIIFNLHVIVGTPLSSGMVLSINSANWIVMRKEFKEGKGYDSYLITKLTHQFTISSSSFYGALFGPTSAFIIDSFGFEKGTSGLKRENTEQFHIIMKTDPKIKKDAYITISGESFIITGYDSITVPGVSYVSMVQSFERDQTAAPTKPVGDTSDDFFWLNGGKE